MSRFLTGLVLLLLAAAAGRSAGAEPDEAFDARDQRRLFTVRDTNAARYKIRDAREALDDGRILQGLHAAQVVLDDMQDDFFLNEEASTPKSTLWRSAAEVVREMLAGLTDEQRAVYETLARPSAAPLLERSLRHGDESGLREVLVRFGASTTGVKAARVLADLALESGRTRDAARYVQEGLRYAPEDVGLWRRLIDAHAAGDDRRSLAALTPPADLSFERDGKTVTLAELQRAALAEIPEPDGRMGWPMWGGVPARNAQLTEETPMPNRLRHKEETEWRVRENDRGPPVFNRGNVSGNFRDTLENFRPIQPVSDGRNVYVCDGRSVSAFDIYSGHRVWRFGDGPKKGGIQLVRPGIRPPGRTSLERAFSPIVAGDLLIATVEVPDFYASDELQGIEITTYLPRRVLVALDLETGQPRWKMGQSGVDKLSLGRLSIVSSPAVAEGLVLAVGSYGDLIHNVDFLAFDLRTGELRWRRGLGAGQQELNLFGSPLKELAASPVAVADGVAYASTGLGFVAAIDIRSGIPRWLASYEISPIRKVQYWYAAPVRMPKMAPCPPVVDGDFLVVAPTDGLHVHAFDRRTGRLVWRRGYQTQRQGHDVPGHFLGVVHDGRRKVVLLTDHELRARDLVSGAVVWHTGFSPERDRVKGRGAVAGKEVLVPTANGLQRFALESDGAYRGSVPWPEGSDPGNLLPLGRVLIVAAREDVQWFYDWAAIERDVQRRRRLRPDDPTILIEAGEIYLRGGGETERALKAFGEARRVARAANLPQHEARAVQGLFNSWIIEGDQRRAFAERAEKAYKKAMEFAQLAEERVLARIRIHRLHDASEDAKARIRNLEGLIDEAEDALGRFETTTPPVPARAMALFLLAREQLGLDRPTQATNALQQILKEERDARFPDGPAGERAQRFVTEILARSGTLPYRRHEQRARELLSKAVSAGDETMLDRLLAEYPNAQVVTDALLERARRLVADGRPLEATHYLRRLLAGAASDHPLVPVALATLARAYGDAGAWGAANGALDRLRRSHGRTHLRWEGKDLTGVEFGELELARIASKRPGPDVRTTLSDTLSVPLKEVHYEPAGDEQQARLLPMAVDNDEHGRPRAAPLTLVLRGQELVAIDLTRARVAWTADTGRCQRGAYTGEVVVVAVSRAFRGLDARTGKELWRRDTAVVVKEMAVRDGQVFALVQDVTPGGGELRLLSFDAHTGTPLWSRELEQAYYDDLRSWQDRLLLKQSTYSRSSRHAALSLGIFDALGGTRLHEIPLPARLESDPLVFGENLFLAGADSNKRSRAVMAIDLRRGSIRWQKPMVGSPSVSALASDGRHLLALRTDGTLLSYAMNDGARLHETRIYVGERARVLPYPPTDLLVGPDRVTFVPLPSGTPLSVLSFDRRTGKLAWDAPFDPKKRPTKAYFRESGPLLCAMIAHHANNTQNALLRILARDSGKVLQEIEPDGLTFAGWLPELVEGHGTVVIVGKSGASIYRGPR